jgi:protein SCO1/2
MRRRFVFAFFFACCLSTPITVKAQQPAARDGVEIDLRGAKVKIPDLVLRDQHGKQVRFYSDLIKDKVVVLSFFYTSCTYICTMQGKVFSELQSLLGERLGKSVFLISITIDPAKDNPQRLKAWAERYKVKPGWTLVTGEEAEMNKLLVQFIGNKAGSEMHLPSTFIANDSKGLWTSAVGVFTPEHLLKVVNSLSQPSITGHF